MKATKLAATAAAVLCAGTIMAADKPDFSGAWKLESPTGTSGTAATTITQKDFDIRLARAGEMDVKCTVTGQECKTKVQGENAKVSYWYNGPVLVEMLVQGKGRDEQVIKTRRTLSEDGQKMTVEIQHIVPAKPVEKLVFVKGDEGAQTASATPQ